MTKPSIYIKISLLIILWLACLFSLPSRAQYYINILGYSADTLYPKLKNASSIEKMHLYNQLAFYHSLSDSDSALYYARMAHELAKKFDDQPEEGFALRNMGNAYALAGNYREAVSHLHRALNIFMELDKPRKVAELYFDLGKLNYDLEDFDKSLDYAEKYLRLKDQESAGGNPVATPFEDAIILGLVAVAAREAGDYPLAERYFKEYIACSKQIKIPVDAHTAYIKSLGETYELAGMLDSALKYTYLARSCLTENKDKSFGEHTGYEGSIGIILAAQGLPDKALPLLKKTYDREVYNKSYPGAASLALHIGELFMDIGRHDSAFRWYQKAMGNAGKVFLQMKLEQSDVGQQIVYSGYQSLMNINQAEVRQRYYRLMLRVYYCLYQFHKITGDPVRALENHEKQYRYKDSLNRAVTNLEERKTQARFESERMEQELQMMAQENQIAQGKARQNRILFYGISGFLIVMLFMILIYIRQNRLKTEQDRILLQQRLFRSQMNPHFLYNSLASIQSFIVTEDPDNASIYLSRFSNLVRSILDSSNEEFVALDREIRLIDNYLALQKVRFPDKFDYIIEIDPDLDTESVMIPPMLAQPFIENAIEHGIKHKKGKGRVTIRIRRSGDQTNSRTVEQLNNRTVEKTIFEVEDDGIGRKAAGEILLKQEETHTSLATVITRKRIASLNKKLNHKIMMEIIDLKDNQGEACGTKVVFVIPFDL